MSVVAAAVFVVGIGVGTADEQAPAVTVDGPYAVTAGVPAQLTGAANVGRLAEAYWYFSDGESARGLTVTRTFYGLGVYTATLTVVNVQGQSFSAATTVVATASCVRGTVAIHDGPHCR